MVRCKFRCTDKQENPDGSASIVLNPVTCGNPENEKFFHYTPWGELKMGTINPEAAKQFEVGKEYYIDIAPTFVPETSEGICTGGCCCERPDK